MMFPVTENQMMSWEELRFTFPDWPVEEVNQLYIDILEDGVNGWY